MTIHHNNHSYSDNTVAVAPYDWQTVYLLEDGKVWSCSSATGRKVNCGSLASFLEKVEQGKLRATLIGKYKP